MRTSNELGAELENLVADKLHGEKVKQSGGGRFWKLDVKVPWLRLVVSCKATAKGKRDATPAIRITKELILEAQRGARGMIGTGDGYEWAIVSEVEGHRVFVCDFDYAALILTERESLPEAPQRSSKAAERRQRSRRSLIG